MRRVLLSFRGLTVWSYPALLCVGLVVVALLGFVGCAFPEATKIPGHKVPPEPPPPPPVFKQATDAFGTAATLAGDFKAGNTVIVWIWYNSGTQDVLQVVDTASGGSSSYARAGEVVTGDFGGRAFRQEIWYANLNNDVTDLTVGAKFSGEFTEEKAIVPHVYESFASGNRLSNVNPNGMSLKLADKGVGNDPNVSVGSDDGKKYDLVFGAAVFSESGETGRGFQTRSKLKNNRTEDAMNAAPVVKFTVVNPPGDWIAHMVAFNVNVGR